MLINMINTIAALSPGDSDLPVTIYKNIDAALQIENSADSFAIYVDDLEIADVSIANLSFFAKEALVIPFGIQEVRVVHADRDTLSTLGGYIDSLPAFLIIDPASPENPKYAIDDLTIEGVFKMIPISNWSAS